MCIVTVQVFTVIKTVDIRMLSKTTESVQWDLKAQANSTNGRTLTSVCVVHLDWKVSQMRKTKRRRKFKPKKRTSKLRRWSKWGRNFKLSKSSLLIWTKVNPNMASPRMVNQFKWCNRQAYPWCNNQANPWCNSQVSLWWFNPQPSNTVANHKWANLWMGSRMITSPN